MPGVLLVLSSNTTKNSGGIVACSIFFVSQVPSKGSSIELETKIMNINVKFAKCFLKHLLCRKLVCGVLCV